MSSVCAILVKKHQRKHVRTIILKLGCKIRRRRCRLILLLLLALATLLFSKPKAFESQHVISNNVAFWQVSTHTTLCIRFSSQKLLMILENKGLLCLVFSLPGILSQLWYLKTLYLVHYFSFFYKRYSSRHWIIYKSFCRWYKSINHCRGSKCRSRTP